MTDSVTDHLIKQSNTNVGICETHIVEERLTLFAHPRFLVMASNVVPVDSILVEVVQDSQAVLRGTTLDEFSVVRLGLVDSAGVSPIVLGAVGGRGKFLEFSSPEPTINVERLQVGALITSLEVTDTTTGPDVLHFVINKLLLDVLVLNSRFS